MSDQTVGEFTLTAPAGDGETKTFEAIPAGEELLCEIEDCFVKEAPWKNDDGEHPQRVNFKFRVQEEGKYKGRILFGNTSTSFVDHPDCKLRGWVKEILGLDEIPIGFRFSTDLLVNEFVVVGVGNYDGKNVDGSVKVRDTAKYVRRNDGDIRAEEAF